MHTVAGALACHGWMKIKIPANRECAICGDVIIFFVSHVIGTWHKRNKPRNTNGVVASVPCAMINDVTCVPFGTFRHVVEF